MNEKFKFEGPTLENDKGRLSEEQIYSQQEFTSRANAAYEYIKRYGIPDGYKESAAIYKEVLKRINATTPVNFEATYALDMAVNRTIWDSDTFSKLPIPTSTMNEVHFEVKDYLVTSKGDPTFTKTFPEPVFMRLEESSQFTNGVGIHVGVAMSSFAIRESQGALWSPEMVLKQEAAAKQGIMKSRRGFMGTSCYKNYADAGGTAANWGITGVYNHASVQTVEAGAGADDDLTAQGDFEPTMYAIAAKLKKVYQPGKVFIFSTSNVASEMFYHRDTYQQVLDVQRVQEAIQRLWGENWGGWYITEQIYTSETTDATHGQMMAVKAAPSLINRQYIWNQQTLPMLSKDYADDLKEHMIFADLLQFKKVDTTNNAVPVTKLADLTVSTASGHLAEGTRLF